MSDRRVSRDIVVDAPPSAVFAVLADPREHGRFDGSGTVRSAIAGPDRLSRGARFGMSMRLGVPYTINNEVVEFDEDRRIAWRHVGHHRWRYELEPVDEDSTRVTETFDWSTARVPKLLELLRYPATNARGIEATLPRLKAHVEGRERS
ncbi:SRPBCC family protein [Actinomycetospora endophytica]|uniref:SRPBCC family protein n=1 Tax=Actinomycetospora endophytica TaxID=2291215 RepID=A0ABS8P776_9PSEU|nr:SRPBCC family protein [Actinomycetospora endophytica]MCD2194110.1 SRPBCC family protein [Actinomycetospora endophytica]